MDDALVLHDVLVELLETGRRLVWDVAEQVVFLVDLDRIYLDVQLLLFVVEHLGPVLTVGCVREHFCRGVTHTLEPRFSLERWNVVGQVPEVFVFLWQVDYRLDLSSICFGAHLLVIAGPVT